MLGIHIIWATNKRGPEKPGIMYRLICTAVSICQNGLSHDEAHILFINFLF